LYLVGIFFQFGPYRLFGRPSISICKYQHCSRLVTAAVLFVCFCPK
jgi:hypothetical protein